MSVFIDAKIIILSFPSRIQLQPGCDEAIEHQGDQGHKDEEAGKEHTQHEGGDDG